jgi:hypothetical protein
VENGRIVVRELEPTHVVEQPAALG